MRRFGMCCLLAVAVVAGSGPADADTTRYALLIGNNRGAVDEATLRYAEQDAEKIHRVLTGLGGFRPENTLLLKGGTAVDVRRAVISFNARMRSTSGDALLFVYYSGHGTSETLHLGDSQLSIALLKQLVISSSATARVLILDSCRSGALTQVKGGKPAPGFPVRFDESLPVEGVVFLTSSSVNEDAQESNQLKGSFFTHYFASGLLGAADRNRDGRVDLNEAYQYAYENTVRASSKTLAGMQHPTFRYQLKGQGAFVLTLLDRNTALRARLTLPSARTYLVFDRNESGAVVAELGAYDQNRTLSLPPGRYFVRGRTRTNLLERHLTLTAGAELRPSDDSFTKVEYARLLRKGQSQHHSLWSVQLGYYTHSALPNGRSLCHGSYLESRLDRQSVSAALRANVCQSSHDNTYVHTTVREYGLEVRLGHAWDAGQLSVEPGVVLGGGLVHQAFKTQGTAPTRISAYGVVAAYLGASYTFSSGFFSSASIAARTHITQLETQGNASLDASVATSLALGLGRFW